MSLPTVNDIAAVDQVLTNLLVGYYQEDTRFVAGKVFPTVNVDKDSGTYYIFTKKYWFLKEMKVHAPGGSFARGGFGVSSTTYTVNLWGLEFPIPDEIRANNQTPMDLEQAAVQWLAQQSLIHKEYSFSSDFMKTSVWATDGSVTAKFSSYSTSDPVGDVLTAKRTVSNATGKSPNTMVMGDIVHARLVNHPDIIDRVKYVMGAKIDDINASLAALFGVQQIFVGRASYTTSNEAVSSPTYSQIIDDDLLICYVEPSPGLMKASAGYTFSWSGAGGNGAIDRYREPATKSDIIRISESWDQKAVATDLGYFYADCTD
jgi:hypothetical protein